MRPHPRRRVGRISDNDALYELGLRLEAVGDGALQEKIYAKVEAAADEVKHKINDSARENLPKRGGLNEWIAIAPVFTRTKAGLHHDIAVFIIMTKQGHDLRSINRGRLRHPVFGDKENWVNQEIKPGYFSNPIKKNLGKIRRSVIAAADEALREIGE